HVDIATFVPASSFGSAVVSTFQAQVLGGGYTGIFGLDDNFLHSPSIAALYGALVGSGLDWSPDTHHVIVYMGSSAPRDPSYAENYYVSGFDPCCGGNQADGWTCEPSMSFGVAVMPNCEGWVRSQDGNSTHSIAGLAHTAQQCVESIGHVCTIDTIDLWDTPTDPYSPGWPKTNPWPHNGIQIGPGAPLVIQDSEHILEAGCDLAAATGGTWDGPSYWTCANGVQGSLQYVAHGSLGTPNGYNPTLMNAFRLVGFGPIEQTLVANGTKLPMFTYVPIGHIQVSSNPAWSTACVTPTGFQAHCQKIPTIYRTNGVLQYGWNWSTVPAENSMYLGDSWTVSFNVISAGGPNQLVPVDACTTLDCKARNSGSLNGIFSWANYAPIANGTPITQSFPLATVTVQGPVGPNFAPPTPPPPPIAPPGLPILTAPALPIVQPVGTLNTIGVSNLSVQAVSAGFLGAGFTRVGMKNRPVALRVAAKSANFQSKFDKASAQGSSTSLGHFE
ncbi:MAG: hypothetical protein L3K09_02900, partial [Thermoplasmata archaeon]|nr:hypothetical protein [Thermoplasmata archaeon]